MRAKARRQLPETKERGRDVVGLLHLTRVEVITPPERYHAPITLEAADELERLER
jgi:hypothetical protein